MAGLEGLRPILEKRLEGGWLARSNDQSADDSLAVVLERGSGSRPDVA